MGDHFNATIARFGGGEGRGEKKKRKMCSRKPAALLCGPPHHVIRFFSRDTDLNLDGRDRFYSKQQGIEISHQSILKGAGSHPVGTMLRQRRHASCVRAFQNQ
jgi:hypothetical protein